MSLRRVTHSIVTRLLLIGIAIILVGAAVRFNLVTKFLREDLETLVAAQQTAVASYIARDVDYKIRERQSMLRQLAKTLPPSMLDQPDQLRAWLGERHELQPLFSQGVFVTDVTGTTITDYPRRPERARVSYADRDYVQQAAAGLPSIGRPVIGRIAREPVLPMAEPVMDGTGKVRAVLVGITALATPGFLDLLQQSRIGGSGGVLLVSPKDQLFVAASDPAVVLKPTPPKGINRLHDLAMSGQHGSGITMNAAGREEISATVAVPVTGWFVVARLPTEEAFATITRMQAFVLRYGGVVIVVFLLLAVGSLITVFRPLFAAADHADRMTRGELPLEPLPVARDDEVGHLTHAFNRLLATLQTSQDELKRMAHHDSLTRLPNRALMADRMTQALARAQRSGSRLAVLFLDLDGFKPVNDKLGHEAGDAALVEVARRLTAIVRDADTLARVGGDEFVIVMCDLDAAKPLAGEAAVKLAAKCISAISTPIAIQGTDVALGASIGIAIGDGSNRGDDLISAADTAMYEAKRNGRGCYVLA